MFNSIQDYTLQLWTLGRKTKKSQSGWVSGNAVCCIHNGHNADTRGRGGLITSDNGKITWHCFNCGFKTSYIPGYQLSFKYRKLLNWLGADATEIQRLAIEALRVKDLIDPAKIEEPEEKIEFTLRKIPSEAQHFLALAEFYQLMSDRPAPKNFIDAVEYVASRHIDMQKYEFYWTPESEHKLSHRVIIPFYFKNQIVGYTARTFVDGIFPKYHSDHPSQFVFNLDQQHKDNKFVLVSEGVFDALAVDGVACLSNEISYQQADLIESLGKKVIIVPDFDQHINKQNKKVWPGKQLILKAIEYNWSVSFPIWSDQVKDISESTVKYGKLFTIKSILDAVESNPVKIQLLMKKYEQKL
jgi:hypothetical protein